MWRIAAEFLVGVSLAMERIVAAACPCSCRSIWSCHPCAAGLGSRGCFVPRAPQSQQFTTDHRPGRLLHDDHVSGSLGDARFGGYRETLLFSAADRTYLRVLPSEFRGNFGGVVGRTVVDNYDLEAGREVGQQLQQRLHLVCQ